eukprot:CAMPEP_0174302590 /NCGR_PEP_ID=MMETSP0809-20121228/59709_1 /TAXON_ID=73025 ORGANISM="Eutreptiella gymnastica-like, Strain CCMP1594" /NCGR_SAMPLE_ID=MMETSP0809 /ASSEMBLY_ACC=CAM_ASM_000658 /LENGTH=289 /DNA_ID=CAMNT_0015408507 /DNA_START=31 /DNA_END=901 /DNA_ORIENTATION=+
MGILSKLKERLRTDNTFHDETIHAPDDGPEYARKKYVPPGNIGHGLWIGPMGSCRTDLCSERNITHIVNTSREVRLFGWVNFEHLEGSGLAVHQVSWTDDERQRIYPSEDLNKALAFIDSGMAAGGNVLVNCSRGVSRSSSVCMAWLMTRKGYSFTQALALVRQARPVANPNPSFAQQLRKLEADCRAAARPPMGHPAPTAAERFSQPSPRYAIAAVGPAPSTLSYYYAMWPCTAMMEHPPQHRVTPAMPSAISSTGRGQLWGFLQTGLQPLQTFSPAHCPCPVSEELQ